jgi:hypothetical protein
VNVRRGLVSLGLAAAVATGSVLVATSSASASTATCGQSYDKYVLPYAGVNTVHARYDVRCQTLAGNIRSVVVDGYIELTAWGKSNNAGASATVVIYQSSKTVAIGFGIDQASLDFSGAGPNANCDVSVYI